MHIIITGAGGFVGRALVSRLLQQNSLPGRPVNRLTLIDTAFSAPPCTDIVRHHQGSIADSAHVAEAFDQPVDMLFHLASIPGGTAEQNYELARDVNLHGTTLLLERAKLQAQSEGSRPVVFVFASTIAVFGSMPATVDDDTPLRPKMTYGAQKLIGEILVADFSRRGWVDGRSVRLPGVLARPPAPTGQLSAFMSDMIRELGAGRSFTCPTSSTATTWASSIGNVVDNLLHAGTVDGAALGDGRTVTLPTLRFSFGDLASAINEVRFDGGTPLVTWKPDARIEALFGAFPPLTTPRALLAGFRADRDLSTLVKRSGV